MNAKGKIIATDLDGTLFYPKKRFRMINTKNKLFLRKFIDNGGRVLLVSGRNLSFLRKVKRRLKRSVDFAGCNGAFVMAGNKFIKRSYLDNDKLLKLLDDVKKRFQPSGVFIMGQEHNFVVPRREFGLFNRFGYACYQFWQGIYKEKTIHGDKVLHQSLAKDKIYKIMLFFGVSKKSVARCKLAHKQMNKLYPDYAFAYNGPSIEVTNRNDTKATGVQHYLDYLKINYHNVMVVGDSGNDISMFQRFTNSFCMAQASNDVKKKARYIIKSVSDLEQYL